MERNNTALAGIKKMIADGIVTQEAAEKYFPELKESEDEKIRRALISFHKSTIDIDGIKGDDILTWLEKQGEHKPTDKYNIRGIKSKHADGKLGEMIKNLKFSDKVEPKFHEGDWVLNNVCFPVQIASIEGDMYRFTDGDALSSSFVDENYHLWSIQDAKDGDVLVDGNLPFIFKKIDTNKHIYAYCGISVDDGFKIESDGESGEWTWMQDIKPATKEQRDNLLKAMAEAGCEFDFEKKEFKKIEQKSTDMIESTPHNYITTNKQFFQWIYDRLIYVHNENPNVDYMLSLKERIENMQNPTWSEEDEKMLDTLIADYEFLSKKYRDQEHDFFVEISLAKDDLDMISWFKSLKDRVCCEANCTTAKQWSEEDKAIFDRANVWLNNLCDYLKNCSSDCIPSEIKNIIKKLESFKERCIWKPSDEQMKVLYKYAEQNNYDGTILTSLYNDLKQL